jgi:hypothetical protein
MEDNQNPVVFAVQSAVLEMLESVEYIIQNDTPERKEELQQEVQKTVLMFIAAIVLANRQFEPSKWPFLSILVDWRDLPGGEVRYLNEYATRWVESSKSAPKFFDAAIQFDSYNHTGIARAMLRQIQLIGNTVSASDGNVSPAELGTVSDYIAFLENKMFAIRSQEISESLVETKLTEVIQDENRAQPQPQSSYIKPPVISQRNDNEKLLEPRLKPLQALQLAERLTSEQLRSEPLFKKENAPELTPTIRLPELQPDDELDEIAIDIVHNFAGSTNLIFVNSKKTIENLAVKLHERSKELKLPTDPFVVHHGSISKDLREEAEAQLKSGIPTTAVCSSTLEMGIDIGSVRAVGQVDTPWSVASMVQRLGRSGRHDGDTAIMRMYVWPCIDLVDKRWVIV